MVYNRKRRNLDQIAIICKIIIEFLEIFIEFLELNILNKFNFYFNFSFSSPTTFRRNNAFIEKGEIIN